MFIINGQKAILRQFNRTDNTNVFDDQNFADIPIKCCAYDVDMSVRFGIYTIPEAIGYFQVPRYVDVQEGDQIIFAQNIINDKEEKAHTYTILKVYDEFLFNRVENKILAVK